MLFNSYIFVFAFLPIELLGFFLIGKRSRKGAMVFTLIMSCVFVSWLNIWYLPALVLSTVVNFLFAKGIIKSQEKVLQSTQEMQNMSDGPKVPTHSGLGWTVVGVVLNILVLFFFKYFNFFAGSINEAFNTNIPMLSLILPLGISFYTFANISYLVDVYQNGDYGYSFLEYASFMTFFPKLVQGPIALHSEIIPKFRDELTYKFNPENASKGIYSFAIGLAKKVLLADTFALLANAGFSQYERIYGLGAVLTMIAYSLQIYFDFSGYCDMAEGVAGMMNIELPMNFNSPYKAVSVSDFWDRWHMTLTRFFTRYIYIPMGGSRVALPKICFNVIVVFLVSGLWHGANWTFILWGALYGILMVIERLFRTFWAKKRANASVSFDGTKDIRRITKEEGTGENSVVKNDTAKNDSGKHNVGVTIGRTLITGLRVALTFMVVTVLWSLFRADSLSKFATLWGRVFHGYFFFEGVNPDMVNSISGLVEINILSKVVPNAVLLKFPGIFVIGLIVLGLCICFFARNVKEKLEKFAPTAGRMAITVLLLLWSILSMSGVTEFIYSYF